MSILKFIKYFIFLFRLINLHPQKSLNILSKSTSSKQATNNSNDLNENEELHRQNVVLLNQFENDVEKVKEAQKRLYEISQLISTFSEKIVEQDLKTDISKNLY